MKLNGRNALVTGGAHRVGKGIALALAGKGCNIFIHYGRSAEDAKETVSEIKSLGVKAASGSANLGDNASLEGLVEAARKELGEISVLINSASGFSEDTIRDVSIEDWKKTMAVSLEAPIFLTKAFVEKLPDGEMGVVVNVTDWRIERPYKNHLSYTIAKSALAEFTKIAAVELGPQVRVNAVALGAILPPPGKDESYLKKITDEIPVKRAGGVNVVADAVVHLIENDFISGEVLRVDGGAHLV